MTSVDIPPARSPRAGVVRYLLLAMGLVAFAVGSIGLFVPLLPTTVFWIAAAWCFGRSRPDLQQRLYEHKTAVRVDQNQMRLIAFKNCQKVVDIGRHATTATANLGRAAHAMNQRVIIGEGQRVGNG